MKSETNTPRFADCAQRQFGFGNLPNEETPINTLSDLMKDSFCMQPSFATV